MYVGYARVSLAVCIYDDSETYLYSLQTFSSGFSLLKIISSTYIRLFVISVKPKASLDVPSTGSQPAKTTSSQQQQQQKSNPSSGEFNCLT